jgi:DNA-binding SARP family transcriptional activator
MLGEPIATPVGGTPVALPSSAWPLIGFLLASPRRKASRDAVATALWPDQSTDSARHCLATALWRLKGAFGEADNPVDAHPADLAVRADCQIWFDTVALERRANRLAGKDRGIDAAARRRIRRTLLASEGDYLPCVDAEWALLERERLRCLRLDALFALAAFEARANDWQAVAATARAVCAAEPLREDAQRLLMVAYARTGNRAMASKQFRACAAALESELGIEPMEETVALHTALCGSKTMKVAPPTGASGSDARSALLAARTSMHRAIELLDTALAGS